MNNRIVTCIRDRSCGPGGIHCGCCNYPARRSRNGVRSRFSRTIRARVNRFVARDIARNPS